MRVGEWVGGTVPRDTVTPINDILPNSPGSPNSGLAPSVMGTEVREPCVPGWKGDSHALKPGPWLSRRPSLSGSTPLPLRWADVPPAAGGPSACWEIIAMAFKPRKVCWFYPVAARYAFAFRGSSDQRSLCISWSLWFVSPLTLLELRWRVCEGEL